MAWPPAKSSCQAPGPIAFLFLWLGAFLLSPPASGQDAAEDWRTLEVPGYRFHTPAQLEPWTRDLVARMDTIHQQVVEQVGFSPEDTVDVLVIDPIARANGSAWSILGKPRMLLYATPPEAGSTLANFDHWPELLTIHETAHLAHLLRPSRNPLKSRLAKLIPMGPLSSKAPKWVTEGYATLLEGRLTGLGRPNGDLRAALLRRWAQSGRLPTYGELNGSSRRWMGGAFPYLVGSAYLEWLLQRSDEKALQRLWARMSARYERSFEAAFRGVFGDSPARLYQRFTAELTYRAMSLEQARQSSLANGELWQDLNWQTGTPAISPDGEQLAVVVRRRGLPSTLVIWPTTEDTEAEEKWKNRQQEIQEADPEDAPASLDRPLPREPMYQLPSNHGAEPQGPRFTADGRSVLFSRREVGSEGAPFPGARVSDLYRWWPTEGRWERITVNAGVRAADPHPDGTWAVAVGQSYGHSRLVRVDLESGEVSPLVEGAHHQAVDHPRLSPDGRHLVYLLHRDGAWQLRWRDLESGADRRLPTPDGAGPAHPAWTHDGQSVVVSVGLGGFIDLYAYQPELGSRRRLTQSPAGAMAPAPAKDGGIFFLALEDDGFDLRRLPPNDHGEPTSAPAWQPGEIDLAAMAPAVRPPAPKIASDDRKASQDQSPESEPYGLGPREHLPLLGGGWNVDGGRLELGLRQGDPVGRFQFWWLAAIGDAEAGFRGTALALRDRRRRIEWSAHAFYGEQQRLGNAGGASFERRRRGLELKLGDSQSRRLASWRWQAGVLWQRQADDFSRWTRGSAFVAAAGRSRQRWGAWHLSQELSVDLQRGQSRATGVSTRLWTRSRLGAGVRLDRRPASGTPGSIALHWRHGRLQGGSEAELFHLGGQRGSLLPVSAVERWNAPVLESYTGFGDRVQSQRVELTIGGSPLALFGERHQIWIAGSPRPPWIRTAGLEWTFSNGAEPLLRLPGVDITVGMGRLLDNADNRGWIQLRWRP